MLKTLTIAAVMTGMTMAGALAAPFCLTQGGASHCMYFDGTACAHDASAANGECTLNLNEVVLPTSGTNAYCVVTSQGAAVCGYADPVACSREALKQHGACARGGSPQQLPNDYLPNAGR